MKLSEAHPVIPSILRTLTYLIEYEYDRGYGDAQSLNLLRIANALKMILKQYLYIHQVEKWHV